MKVSRIPLNIYKNILHPFNSCQYPCISKHPPRASEWEDVLEECIMLLVVYDILDQELSTATEWRGMFD